MRPLGRIAAAGIGLLCLAFAGPDGVTLVEDWTRYAPGAQGPPGKWAPYGPAAPRQTIAVVLDGERRALRLKTDHSSIRLGRRADIDLSRTPWLHWEWKPLTLPRQGNIQSAINDQVARVFVIFGSALRPRAIGYVWDTAAPVGTVTARKNVLLDRRLVVVRSGADGVGRWHTERRHVRDDYVRFFGSSPDTVRGIGIESHSEDAAHESDVLVGRLFFTDQP